MVIVMATDYKIICDKCGVINRVPLSRLGDQPKCGKCQKKLFDGGLLEMSDSTFQRVIAASSQPLLVMFWAPWCGYCQKTLPAFKQAAQQLEPNVRLATLNTEIHKSSARRSSIEGLPTVVLFQNGREVACQPGAMNHGQIVNWTRSKLLSRA
jgi:thioredoxin 2